MTCILQPLILDKDEKREMTRHSENLDRIKLALAGLKIGDENITMEEFLDIIFLKRSPNELRVNNFNVHCLKVFRSNMDTQFILNIYVCATYTTSYVAKSARGMSELLKKACDEAKLGNSNLKQQVRIIDNKFLNNVEVSAQEAVYILLQLPLKKSSRQVIFINTSPPAERVYLLNSNIDNLPDDDDVAESNIISRYVAQVR